jgi:predicted deacylase
MGDEDIICEAIQGGSGPRLLITGGVHGDEYEPMAAIRTLSGRLCEETIQGTAILVPVVNAAAYRLGQRVAEDGLDLARVCPGNAQGAITERAAYALSRLILSADFYIDLHTGGKSLTLFPLAGYMLHRDANVLESQRRMARAFNLPLIWGTTPDLEGRSLSVARDANVPAIYVEIGGGGGPLNRQAVYDMVEGCLNVMAELKMLQRQRPAPRIRHIAETPGKQSGFLQINYPSPIEGIFEPAVSPGDVIHEGAPIGRAFDPQTDKSVSIPAKESGLVVMLRADARVHREDALATIIPGIGEKYV